MTNQDDYTGQRLGHYRLIRLLGQGGFAEVYLAEHIHLQTQVAVKLLHTRLAQGDIENFRQEAQTIARLVHANIVRVLDFGVENNAPYLVMDFAPQGTLRNHHPKGTQVPLATVVSYVKQIAEALYYAHSHSLIHRDIKPENVLVGRNNEVLLSDFGIALIAQSSSQLSTKDVAGTIVYMAPEQIQAHPRPASDQYSLGVVVYEWLSGKRPFEGTYTEVAIKHTMAPPPPLRGQVPGLLPAVEDVVMRALHKDPRQRFPNTRAFAHALEQASLNASFHTVPYMDTQQQGASLQPLPIPGSAYESPPQAYTPIMQPPQPNTGLQHPALGPNPVPPAGSQYGQHASYNTPTPGGTPVYNRYDPQQGAFNSQPPLYAMETNLITPAPRQLPPRRFSRRAVIGGVALAAVAASGGVTWYLVSQKLSSLSTFNPSQYYGNTGTTTTNSGSNGSTSTGASGTALVTYSGHSDYIWSVAWSPDSKSIVSCSQDGTAQVWDASAGKKLLATRSHLSPAIADDFAKSVTWAPNSKQILTGFQDGTAESFDLNSRQHLSYTGDDTSVVNAVAWSPDGRYIAVGHFFNTVMIYEAATSKPLLTYNGHSDGILALAWSHDGKRVASGSSDGTAQVWRPSDGRPLLVNKNHGDDVRSISWSPDDSRIVSGAWDGKALVWDSVTGNTLLTYTKHTGGMVNAVAWSPNGTYIASGGNDVNTHIWEAQSGNIVHKFYTFPIFSLAWSPDSSRIVTAGYNKVGKVWSAQ